MGIHAQGLVKRYRKRIVVQDVSLHVDRGEIVGLLGPNGAGKTTTFAMIVGLIRPDKGCIQVNETEVATWPMYLRSRLGVGYLPQEPSVFRKLTVEDNLRAVLQLHGVYGSKQQDKLEQLLEEFRLGEVRRNLGTQLSGGERRRTEIARALAAEPEYLLLDEPFAGVDPIAVAEIQGIIETLKEKRIGVLVTDHNVRETLRITDRTYIMHEGTILVSGTAEQLAEDALARQYYLGASFRL